ncbi:hypothetical protein Lalb_Chr06g0173661 [Lupinus albus]|uniref:Uncharacterized protein n=1 Tax=Lupinus albus TaxID=3870 RepID=A0A6A4QF72_LUPAL|nr:hypothetical protein Lalb_Chr06g0173661 [Lupinus albus]
MRISRTDTSNQIVGKELAQGSHTLGISRIDTRSHIVVGVFKIGSHNAVRI